MPFRYPFKSPVKRFLAICFDAIGTFLFSRKDKSSGLTGRNIQKILVIRLDHLGDVVMTKPALSALRRRFPDAEINLLLSDDLAPLFQKDKDVTRTISFKHHWFSRSRSWIKMFAETRQLIQTLRQNRYDLGIDFRGDLRHILLMHLAGIPLTAGYGLTGGGFLLDVVPDYPHASHQVTVNHRLLEALGISQLEEMTPFEISEETLKKWNDFLKDKKGFRVVLHPGAGYPSKRWPAAHYQALIRDLLHKSPIQILLIGTQSEKGQFYFESNWVTDLRGKTTLEDLPVLFRLCDVYVGNDSGPAHLAAAQGMPVVSLFSGTNDPEIWKPWGENVKVLNFPVPCSPCGAQECPLEHHECMKNLMPSRVAEEILLGMTEKV